jgi:hypothetical protein
MKKILLTVALLAVTAISNATVMISPTISTLYEKDGVTKFDPGQLFLLVVDTDHNGFGPQGNGSIGFNYVLGEDDKVLKAWDSVGGLGLGKCTPAATGLVLEDLTGNVAGKFSAGDPFGIFWFDDLSTTDYLAHTPLTMGSFYGFYTQSSFLTPSDSGAFSETATGLTLIPNQALIPEPATALLALAGSGVIYALRRKVGLIG